MWVKILGCIITALVSSQGHVINVDHLRKLQDSPTGCLVYQYYNPPIIYSDWTCKQVEDSIIDAIIMGCDNGRI